MAFVPFEHSFSSPPFYGCCPDCGRSFSLLDLALMAEGDGWVRYISLGYDPELMKAYHPSFTEFNPRGEERIDFSRRADFSLGAVMRRRDDGSFELIAKPAKLAGATRLTLGADFDDALAELAALSEAAAAHPDIARRIAVMLDGGLAPFRLEQDRAAAAGTGEIIFRAHLADALRALLPDADEASP